MRVGIYAGVSTLIGQSTEMQLAELREYAARRGWESMANMWTQESPVRRNRARNSIA